MIQHVAIEVRREDVDACLHFWWLLGFERVPAPDALAERAAWVQAGATQVHLLFADEPTVPPEGHVAVVVGDYEATLAALRASGFQPDPRAEHWGSPRSYVRDPAGNLVEMMAFAPGGAQG
jgi:catechol 2,3-dioxygenase-like lactoylglutathione lyase family enzyme